MGHHHLETKIMAAVMEERKSEVYRSLSASLALPLYFQPHWLDAVAGPQGWDVALAFDKGGRLTGLWVYCLRRHWAGGRIVMPPLTAYSGPLLYYPKNMTATDARYAFEKRVLYELMDQLPPVHFFYQEWLPGVENWLPAYWRGYRQTTHYTYRLDELSDWNAVFDHFRSNVRTHIRKAEAGVRVFESEDVEALYRLYASAFHRQGKTPLVSLPVLQEADAALRRQRLILLAEDEAGKLHAGVYLAWDAQTAYYLLSGADPALRHSGALYLLVWDALQFCSRQGLAFDFEGSMLEPVEEVFRGFGGKLTPHHKIFKARSRWLEAAATLLGKSGF